MSANFLLAGIVAGLVSGLGLNGTFDALIEGMQNILFGAMIVDSLKESLLFWKMVKSSIRLFMA